MSDPSLPQRVLGRLRRELRGLGFSARPPRKRRLDRDELIDRIAEQQRGLVAELNFEDRDLSNLDLRGLIAEKLTLTRCRLRKTRLDGSKFLEVRLVDCDCRGLSAVRAAWGDVVLERCVLSESDLTGIALSGTCEAVRLDRSLLVDARLDGANLYAAFLVESDLRGASLKGAVLEEADLSRANVFDTKCSKARSRGAVFENAVCIGADFRDADLTDASFVDCLARVADYRKAVLRRAVFRCADVGEADFSDAETTGIVFEGSRLWKAKGLDSIVSGEAD